MTDIPRKREPRVQKGHKRGKKRSSTHRALHVQVNPTRS
jgi:hypothetical protein